MKKNLIHAMCLSASMLVLGAVDCGAAATAFASPLAAVNQDDSETTKEDVTIGDETNSATFSWSGTTLTITGKGDLSKISTTDSKSFAEYLSTAIGEEYMTVIFKTAANEDSPAQIDKTIVHALLAIKSITTLNLSEVMIDAIISPFPKIANNDWTPSEEGTFMADNNGKENTTLQVLYTPQVKSNSSLPGYAFYKVPNLVELHISEGIKTLEKWSLQIQNQGFGQKLTTLVFPNSLEYAKTEAAQGLQYIETFTFPAGMKEIETKAFGGTKPKDVYFLGKDAPKVAIYAWGNDAYIANNALSSPVEDGQSGTTVKVDMATGYACRSNYKAQSGWECMLHYPAACTKAQAARYTDITRDYRRIDKGSEGDGFSSPKDADGKITYTYYTPGKETKSTSDENYSTLKGNSTITNDNATQNPCKIRFQSGDETTAGFTYDHTHSYTGGFYDMYVGSQYLWPSMDMAYRATVVAQNNVLWDGTTTIAEGIKNAGDSEYTGDGKEYIGLHQFVFAQGDVTTDKTDEWDMTKYADGIWHTICLPFNMTKGQMKEVFGKNEQGDYSHIRLCEFSKVTRTTGEDAQIKLHFNTEKFHAAESDDDIVLKAHVSYMIHAQKEEVAEGEKIVLKNYVTVAGSPEPTNITASDEKTNYYFIGNYQTDITMPQYCYFFVKAQAFKFQGAENGKWTAYTSVVQTADGSADNDAFFTDGGSTSKLSTLLDGEGETDGIEKVTIEADGEIVYTSANVYNLNGQLVSTRGKQGLAKGIYVQNGKKFIVK